MARGAHAAESDVIYVGSSLGMETTLVPRAGIPTHLVPMKAPSSPRGVLLLGLAIVRVLALILRRRPAVTLATGGYVSVPAVMASWLARVPVVLFLPDIVPGRAIAWLAPLATRIAVSAEDATRFLPARKTSVTGYPVRDDFDRADRARSRIRLGVPNDIPLLLVFGASQGARSINEALATCLPEVLPACHVLHICGEPRLREAEEAADRIPTVLRDRYSLVPYLHGEEMAGALMAADLAVCRSGASTVGELPLAGLPSILVPFPDVAVHQRENAEYLVSHGAAVTIDDHDLGTRLGPTVLGLLSDAPRLERMAAAARSLARPDAAEKIASLVLETAS